MPSCPFLFFLLWNASDNRSLPPPRCLYHCVCERPFLRQWSENWWMRNMILVLTKTFLVEFQSVFFVDLNLVRCFVFFFVLHLKPSDLQYLNIFGQIRQTRQNSNHLRISNKFTANHIPALFPATDVSYSFVLKWTLWQCFHTIVYLANNFNHLLITNCFSCFNHLSIRPNFS